MIHWIHIQSAVTTTTTQKELKRLTEAFLFELQTTERRKQSSERKEEYEKINEQEV